MAIARKSARFTAVARTRKSLNALAHDIGPVSERQHSYIDLDWNDQDQFLTVLSNRLSRHESPSLVVAWLHNASFGPRLANALSERGSPCVFYQILGSAGRGPSSEAAALKDHIEGHSILAYRQVILGFMREESLSRWLTNDEISDGVLDAISAGQSSYVIGTVTPWHERPDAA